MKKMFLVLLSMIICFSLSTAPAFALSNPEDKATGNVSAESMYNYLIEAGYPVSVIENLNETAIAKIYYGGYEYQSSSITYGIMTEEYSITYELDDSGNVIIDAENLRQFNELLNDKEVVEKICADKNYSLECQKAMNMRRGNFLNNNIDKNISSPRDAEIQTLSNWVGIVMINKISQSNTKLEKQIVYAWIWDYSPVWNLTDKAAVAWSKGFTLDPSSAEWSYTANGDLGYNVTGGSRRAKQTWDGIGCTEYEPDCGFGQDIDIRFDFKIDGLTYRTFQHSGLIYGNLTKYLTGAEQGAQNTASAVGRYYHKRIGLAGSLSFSMSGPSISLSHDGSYDASPDTGAQFDFYQ